MQLYNKIQGGGGGESAHHTLILDIKSDSKRCDSIAHSHKILSLVITTINNLFILQKLQGPENLAQKTLISLT